MEAALDLATDDNEIGSFDHNVNGSDNLGLGEGPDVQVCNDGNGMSMGSGWKRSLPLTVNIDNTGNGSNGGTQPLEGHRGRNTLKENERSGFD